MVYIEIKTINGKKYKYLRRSIRTEGKIKKITLKCLGPVDPVYRVRKKRKTNASLYARSIDGKEKEALRKALQSSNAFTRDRARIILLSMKKYASPRIAEKVNCDKRKVRNAIKAFNVLGIKALERGKSSGRKPKVSETDKKIILIHFAKSPREFGIPISAWTIPKFAEHLRKNKIVDISDEWVRKILLKAGAKLTKSKRWQYSPDKNFLKKRE